VICILHGYLLEGSGSNLWTGAIVRALCREGQAVHLVCQELHPHTYDFIAAANVYEHDGSVTKLFTRETPYAAGCVMHKPRLGETLPVYVRDQYEEFAHVVPMVELADEAIEAYLARNVMVVERVVREHGVTSMHANHAVLMSVVAERVSTATGVPFAIMPHGSAIEYGVKKDRRMHDLAAAAFNRAARIFAIGPEMRRRIIGVFPDQFGLESKISELNLGVDTDAFSVVDRNDRGNRIARLSGVLKDVRRGKPPEAERKLRERLSSNIGVESLRDTLAEVRGYEGKRPDVGVEAKLATVEWDRDEVLLFVGRLIASKGPQNIVAALPRIIASHPRARLLIVGHGPLREVLEALLWALAHGDRTLASNIVLWGSALEGGEATPFEEIRLYFEALEARSQLDDYFTTAQAVARPERVIFTGYLTHANLRYLMPCCDVAIFPSIVAEAGPLVFLEALASGVFPLGTYFGGMAASIDSVAGDLPVDDAALMKVSPDPNKTIANIIANTEDALALGRRHADRLHRSVVARYDWVEVARKLAAELAALES
jgi:glycosyltransferase involved in cell wall biosynthesis